MKPTSAIALACACGFSVVAIGAASGEVTLLGDDTLARGISADGRVVVGSVFAAAQPVERAFRWTATGGLVPLTATTGSAAHGVSGNGVVTVGWSPSLPARWNGTGPTQSIPGIDPFVGGYAVGASNDGSTIVGYMQTGTIPPNRTAFRWTASGGTQLLNVASGDEEMRGISRDGTTLVGSGLFGGTRNGFVWTEAGGVHRLMFSESGVSSTDAFAVNNDGTIVLGRSGFRGVPTVWRNDIRTAYTLPSTWSGAVPACIDDSGMIFGGSAAVSGMVQSQAFVWTQSRGMELLTDYVGSFGLNFPAGYTAMEVTGMSSDGRTICGWGAGGAFVVTVPEPGSMAVLGLVVGIAARRRRR